MNFNVFTKLELTNIINNSDFSDESHLNYNGSIKLSFHLGNYIKKSMDAKR